MQAQATQAEAYDLLHRGAIALAAVEEAGIAVDVDYLDHAIERTGARIRNLEEKLRGCEEYQLQRRRYGAKTNLTSRDQLAAVLFEDQGHEIHSYSESGKPQLDEEALQKVGSRYARGFIRLEKLNKVLGTYLLGLRRHVMDDGRVRSSFGLHAVRSFRGQSDSPNFQNFPIRDPVQGEVVRRAFVPRDDDHVLVEVDYGSVEVRFACVLSGDPKLTYDTIEGDMHRDMAAECYLLDHDEVSKAARQNAKGGFVFAEFYGDWYKQCAINLWDGIERYGLTTTGGVDLISHLAANGITELGDCDPRNDPLPGTFEGHIREVERRFWNERFKVYHRKRRAWVEEYKRQGYIDIVTGFRCHGPMSKNQVMNYHIQGPAFHGLLWSLTRLVREIRRRKWRTRVVGQIHDSIIADVHRDELEDYLDLTQQITTVDLVRAWPWISVPLVVEAEVAETCWHEKTPVELPNG